MLINQMQSNLLLVKQYVKFGGEYYDGAENIVFDDLLRWDPDFKQSTSDDEDEDVGKNTSSNESPGANKGKWTRIHTPQPHPPPRCAHSAVFYKDSIYIFGGECATAEKYHHYRDMWKLDVKKNVWEEVRSRNGTPPGKDRAISFINVVTHDNCSRLT